MLENYSSFHPNLRGKVDWIGTDMETVLLFVPLSTRHMSVFMG